MRLAMNFEGAEMGCRALAALIQAVTGREKSVVRPGAGCTSVESG